MPNNGPEADGNRPGAPREKPKSRARRARRVIGLLAGILVVILAMCVALAPTILSIPAVSSLALSVANARLRGAINIERLSLSWTGPAEIIGVQVRDADSREVLAADRIVSSTGAWGLLTSGLKGAQFEVVRPEITLYIAPNGELSIGSAFEPPTGESASTPGAKSRGFQAEWNGGVAVRDGKIRVEREPGASYRVSDVNGTVNLQAGARIKAKLSAMLEGDGTIELEADLQNLVANESVGFRNVTGSIRARTDGEARIGPIAAIAGDESGLEGAAKLDIDAVFSSGSGHATVDIVLAGVQTRERATANADPIDVSVKGVAELAANTIHADLALGGTAGTITAKLIASIEKRPNDLTTERVIAALFSGEPLILPDVLIAADGKLDIAALGRAAPGILNVREDTTLTAGSIDFRNLSLRGGAAREAGGEISLHGIVANGPAGLIELKPMLVKFDAGLKDGIGLEVREAELDSVFAQIKASGTPTQLDATFSCDLAVMRRELAQVFDFGELELVGSVQGAVAVKKSDPDRIEVVGQATATELHAATPDQTIDLAAAKVGHVGWITLKDGSFHGGASESSLDVALTGFRITDRTVADVKPVDLTVQGDVIYASDSVRADLVLGGAAGSINSKLVASLIQAPPVTTDLILSAMLGGEPLALPDFSVEADGRLDLAALGQAIPGLLNVRRDTTIHAGSLEFKGLSLRGGPSPGAAGDISIQDLAATGPGGAFRLSPIQIRFEAGLKDRAGLDVHEARFESKFATLNATGTPEQLDAQFDFDLAGMQRELAQIFEFGEAVFSGNVRGAVALHRENADQIGIKGAADASGLRITSAGNRFDLGTGRLAQDGRIMFKDGVLARIDFGEMRADLDGQVVATANGWYDPRSQTLDMKLAVERADLAFFGARGGGHGAGELSRYGGTASGDLALRRTANDQSIVSSGTMRFRGLTVDRQPLSHQDALLRWSNAQIDPENLNARAASVQLESALASLTAKDVELQTHPRLAAGGNVKAAADLAPLLHAFALISKEPAPEIGGKLDLAGRFSTRGESVLLLGGGHIDDFAAGAGESRFREKRVQFGYDAEVDGAARRITIKKASLQATPLSLDASGRIDRYDSDCTLAIQGSYSAKWESLMSVLREITPGSDALVVRGESRSTFEIKGPLRAANAKPPFRGLAGGTEIRWSSAEVQGLRLGGATLAPQLKDAQIYLPTVKIAASDGTVNLGGRIELSDETPALLIRGKLPLLENVAITPELARELLSRVNPIFRHTTRIEGRTTLLLQDVHAPLGEQIKHRGKGTGRLDLRSLQIQPGGIIGELLKLGGVIDEKMQAVTMSVVTLKLENGRISYDNLTLKFPDGFDLKFYGSVGLDDTVDLVVSLPVRPALLARLGVKDPDSRFAKALAKTRIDVPMVGTRQSPKLDLSRINMAKLLEGVLLEAPKQGVGDLLRGIPGIPWVRPTPDKEPAPRRDEAPRGGRNRVRPRE